VALVDDILGFFRTNYTPAAGQFLRFDQERLAGSLRLRERGKERGAKDQPPSDAADIDTDEQSIAEAMRQQALIDEARTREELDHYTERLKAANPAGQAGAMFMEAQTAVAGFRNAMLSARTILDRERKNVIERDQQVSLFRARHNLDRPPNPVKGHWVMILLLAACFVLEIGINSSVLSAGSEFGLLGGVVGAFFYTFLSMSLSMILGLFGLTLLIHINWGVKVVGLVGSLLLIGAILFVNLLAAHYRIAITSNLPEIEAAQVAMRTLFSDTGLFLTDTQSVLMVGVSLVVAFATVMEGLFWQDPYPGYARVQKYSLQAHARWVRSLDDHRGELEDIYREHTDRIRALQTSLANRQNMIPQIIGNRRRLVQSFNTHLKHIQDVGRFLISTYREANHETRKTSNPRYFSRPWKLDAVSQMEMPPDSDAGDAGAWQDVGNQLKEASRELHAAHEEAVAWIEALSKSESAAHADARTAADQRSAKDTDGDKSGRPSLTVVGDKA
jgi:hypothetical protein